jgi:uncharacterized membrane protein
MATHSSRLAYIDWMRGLACVLMFQTHCYDSWLGGDARKTTFFMWSQLGGTLPAPLFLFLAGVSFALVTDKLRQKQIAPAAIARGTIRRGAEILGLGLLFRVQEYVIAFPWAPWTDLLRVDVLNMIGVSMMLMGLMCWAVLVLRWSRVSSILAGVSVALTISFLSPLFWTTWRPDWLPWPLESYINGVHNLGVPQAWLFPIFPWTAFAFMGLAVGFFLLSDWARQVGAGAFGICAAVGIALFYFSRWLDARPTQIYPVYDYWHTSPEFFLLRIALLLMILGGVYAWVRWGAGQWGFSPLIQLGQTSLLVYWVHIEFVYGRLSILHKKVNDIPTASFGLLTIFLAMLLLSFLRTKYKGRGAELWDWVRRPKARLAIAE